MRRCEKLSLCLTELMPASSKTDPPVAKAEPISDGSSTSVITYLRRGGRGGNGRGDTTRGARLLQDLWTHGEKRLHWSRFAGRTYDLVEGTHAAAAGEELYPVGRSRAGAVCRGLSSARGNPQ